MICLTSDAGPVSDPDATHGVVRDGCHLAGAARAVTVLVRAVVPRHRVVIAAVDVLARSRVLQ